MQGPSEVHLRAKNQIGTKIMVLMTAKNVLLLAACFLLAISIKIDNRQSTIFVSKKKSTISIKFDNFCLELDSEKIDNRQSTIDNFHSTIDIFNKIWASRFAPISQEWSLHSRGFVRGSKIDQAWRMSLLQSISFFCEICRYWPSYISSFQSACNIFYLQQDI